MTNIDETESCDPRVAALLAVHLVSQVLDEAYVIAIAAKESGEPWTYISNLKKFRTSRLDDTCVDDLTFTVSKGDYKYVDENNVDTEVVTSTPQKSGDFARSKNDASFIGQGDEDFEATNNKLRKSTSMFINNLFDMSDVERLFCKEPEYTSMVQNSTVSNEILTEDITRIIDSYVNDALNTVLGEVPNLDEAKSNNSQRDTATSSYSYLADAFCPDAAQNLAFYINEVACNETKEIRDEDEVACNETKVIKDEDDEVACNETKEIIDEDDEVACNETKEIIDDDDEVACNETKEIKDDETSSFQNAPKINSDDIAMYENAYLTLNRDYEASDEEEPVLRDPKTMMMQEVELLTANTSSDSVLSKQDVKALAATSGVSTQLSRKSNLVRRCRIQGSKLFSCLKGLWWRRRLGKRKECRGPGPIHGLCPLSPDARRRAASLLDQRNLRTPSPSRAVLWKFNTVNEALVHSSRWKDYGFKMSLNENDEF